MPIIEGNVGITGATINVTGGYSTVSDADGNFTIDVPTGVRTFTPEREGTTFDPVALEHNVLEDYTNCAPELTALDGVVEIWQVYSSGNYVYVAGKFDYCDGVAHSGVFRMWRSSGLVDHDFVFNISGGAGYVACIHQGGAAIYFGGAFTHVNGANSPYIFGVSDSTEILIPSTLGLNGVVRAIASVSTYLVIGGWFTNYLKKVSTQLNSSSSYPTTNGVVYALASIGIGLAVGGNFTQMNGVASERFAVINSSNVPIEVNQFRFNDAVRKIMYTGAPTQQVYIGGAFTQLYARGSNIPLNRIARLDFSTGTLEYSPFFVHFDNTVHEIRATTNGEGSLQYWCTGLFSTVTIGTTAYSAERVCSFYPFANSATLVPDFAVDIEGSAVYSANVVDPYISGVPHLALLLGGNFSTVDGVPRTSLGRVNLSDGTLLQGLVFEQSTSTYTLEYAAGVGGIVLGDHSQTVYYGEDGTVVEARANTGYVFEKWSDDVTDNPRQDVDVNANIDVEAQFVASGFLRVIGTRGEWSIDGGDTWYPVGDSYQALTVGGEATITFKAVEGYTTPATKTVTITLGTYQECTSEYTPVNCTISGNVSFEGVSIGGALSNADGEYVVTVPYGTTITLEPTFEGYAFCPSKRTFQNVITDYTDQDHVPIDSGLTEVELTLVVQGAGAVSGGGVYAVGATAAITAIAETGWVFSQWSDGDTNSTRSIVMEYPRSLTAIFVKATFVITAAVVGSGTVAPLTQTVAYGDTVEVVATPAQGNVVQGWFTDGIRVSTQRRYTFIAQRALDLIARIILNESLPIGEKEIVGICVDELDTTNLATVGNGIAVGISRVNDTIAYPLDQEYLAIKADGLYSQVGDFDEPEEQTKHLGFTPEGIETNQVDTLKVVTDEVLAEEATVGDLSVSNLTVTSMTMVENWVLQKGLTEFADNFFATGYFGVGQGDETALRPGAIRYTGATRAEVITCDGANITFDQSFANIIGLTLVYRAGAVQYTLLAGSGASYVLDAPGQVGECVILGAGDWEGWNGTHWVSLTGDGGGGLGAPENDGSFLYSEDGAWVEKTAAEVRVLLEEPSEWIELATIEDIQKIGNDPAYPLNGQYKLVGPHIAAGGTQTWNAGTGFMPIGTEAVPFTGIFDGDGRTISNLFISRNANYQGLFGACTGTIRNLIMDGLELNGLSYVGALAGRLSGTVENVRISGSVTGFEYVGGLVGYSTGPLFDFSFDGVVNGGSYVGGVCGFLVHTTGAASLTSGRVSGGVASSMAAAGGLVGKCNGGYLLNCGSFTTVNAPGNRGGLIGSAKGTAGTIYVQKCIAVGDLFAYMGPGAGGLIGQTAVFDMPTNTLVTNSFYDSTLSGCGDTGYGTPKTTANMKLRSTFTAFDFVTKWYCDDLSYPALRNLNDAVSVVLEGKTVLFGDWAIDGTGTDLVFYRNVGGVWTQKHVIEGD